MTPNPQRQGIAAARHAQEQRASDFAGSASREYQKFQGKPRRGMRVGCPNPADRLADLCIRQRFVMFLPPALLRQRRACGHHLGCI